MTGRLYYMNTTKDDFHLICITEYVAQLGNSRLLTAEDGALVTTIVTDDPPHGEHTIDSNSRRSRNNCLMTIAPSK
jgi:hypothetical protein